MNNKGFAISTMLYGLIIIIVLVMVTILSTMAFNRKTNKEFASSIQNDLENMEKSRKIEVGSYIYMMPLRNSYSYNDSGVSTPQSVDLSELSLWRVLKISDDGIVAISHYTSTNSVAFYGPMGYANYVGVLNNIAKQYQDNRYTVGSRMIGYNGQTERITMTNLFDDTFKDDNCKTPTVSEQLGGGDELYKEDTDLVKSVYGNLVAHTRGTTTGTQYLIPSRKYVYRNPQNCCYVGCKISESGDVDCNSALRQYDGNWNSGVVSGRIRPILVFKPDISPTGGDGTEEIPYTFS